jgi:hypothetical protein
VLSITSVREVKFEENIDYGVTYWMIPILIWHDGRSIAAYTAPRKSRPLSLCKGKETHAKLSETVFQSLATSGVKRHENFAAFGQHGTFVIPLRA